MMRTRRIRRDEGTCSNCKEKEVAVYKIKSNQLCSRCLDVYRTKRGDV
jgi:hypothetical protein